MPISLQSAVRPLRTFIGLRCHSLQEVYSMYRRRRLRGRRVGKEGGEGWREGREDWREGGRARAS